MPSHPEPAASPAEDVGLPATASVPRVSVVLPVYNGEDQLEPAVESILNQTMRDLELIVVDDGSTDGTPLLLQRFADRDPRVKVHRQQHSGIVAALNRGCGLARARYIARMDADDIALPDRLAKQVAFLDERDGVALVGGSVEYILGDGLRTRLRSLPTAPTEIADRLIIGKHCFVHPTVVMRADAFARVGGYRAAFEGAEDADLWLRMAELFDLANIGDVVLTKRVHPAQVSTRHMEQSIVRALGAQAAARIRRATGQDPILQNEAVTRATLRRLGVPDQVLQEHLIQGYRNNFRAFREAGNPEGALSLLRNQRMAWKVRHALRGEYALALLRRAKREYGERRLLRGSIALLQACVARPSLLWERLAARVRSALVS